MFEPVVMLDHHVALAVWLVVVLLAVLVVLGWVCAAQLVGLRSLAVARDKRERART
jgi:hypothetical protein